jgi:hypothetical protein
LERVSNSQYKEKAMGIKTMSFNEEALRLFMYWIDERHHIHLARSSPSPKPPPWSDDPIFQSVFFTNPYRENDKTTIWFRENIRNRFKDDPKLALFTAVCFRWFNYIPTGFVLCDPYPVGSESDKRYEVRDRCWDHRSKAGKENLFLNWNMHSAIDRLTTWNRRFGKIFTGAYIIKSPDRRHKGFTQGLTSPVFNFTEPIRKPPSKSPTFAGLPWLPKQTDGVYDKIEAICWAINNVWLDLDSLVEVGAFCDKSRTLKDAFELLLEYPYLGEFMTYEVITDLRHTCLLRDATDINTWCNMGPGATRGLRRLYALPAKGPLPKEYRDGMQWLLEYTNGYFRKETKFPKFEMREIEHSLCEFDKYERARLREGDLKRQFQGT